MEFSILGALSVRLDGEEPAIGRAKPRALLSLLLGDLARWMSGDHSSNNDWRPES